MYKKAIGRIELEVSNDGLSMHDYAHGAILRIRDGWNIHCKIVENRLSVDELHDLRYVIDRAIALANERKNKL